MTAPALPARWTIWTYVCPDAPEGFRAVAHMFAPLGVGRTPERIVSLPATAWADEPMTAADRLRGFLSNQIELERQRSAKAEATAERNRRRAA